MTRLVQLHMSQVVGFPKVQNFDPMDVGFLFHKENHQLHYAVWYQKCFDLLKGFYYKEKQGESPLIDMRLYMKTSHMCDLLAWNH